MKKKLAIMVITVIMSIGLLACGSKNSDSDAAESEVVPSIEISSEDKIENEETEETGETEKETDEQLESEAAEIVEEEELTPTWYMDEEGIKNDEFGVVIRKDTLNPEYSGLGININDNGQHVFHCYYYDGDLDSYIEEHNAEKNSRGELSYAYYVDGSGSGGTVAFVDNGIMFSATVFDGINLDEYLDLITSYEETDADYLAYLTDGGLYCPALGLCIGNSKDKISNIGVNCFFGDWTESAILSISDESKTDMPMAYMVDAENAQEVVDKYVENLLTPSEDIASEFSAFEDTVETNIGKFKYLGRGVKNETWDEEEWLFYSDEATWSVSLSYKDGKSYEDYIGLIENLE
jgi:hypothetical protein